MPAVRPAWSDLPAHVRAAVDDLLGSPVVHTVSQPGGFSPGSADRVVCADGRRAFVKAAVSDVNAEVVPIHRAEAAAAAVMPASVPAPRFLGVADGGDWIALAFEEVHGVHPAMPWRPHDVTAVLDALAATARTPLDARAVDAIPPVADLMTGMASGWERLRDEPFAPASADPDVAWVLERTARWVDETAAIVDETAGESLLHADCRDDNVLLRPSGEAVLIDWPWARRGAAWIDPLLLLINVRLHDPDADLAGLLDHAAFDGMPSAAADHGLAAAAGFFLDHGRRPDPPGLPALRAFQLAQAAVTCGMLRERVG